MPAVAVARAGVIRAFARGMPDDPRHVLGQLGETLACGELRRRGYEILATRYRTRYGEIDIIARHEGVYVFVEVKTRTADDFGGGLEAVTAGKRRRIARMAMEFVHQQQLSDTPCRFDVVVVASGGRVEVFEDAFDSAY